MNLNRAMASWRGTSLGEKDSSWNADFFTGVCCIGSLNDPSGLVDDRYHVEIAIPWKILDFEPHANDELLINFAVSDRRMQSSGVAGKELNSHTYAWSGGANNFSDPVQWNKLVLLKAPGDGLLLDEEENILNSGHVPEKRVQLGALIWILPALFIAVCGYFWVLSLRRRVPLQREVSVQNDCLPEIFLKSDEQNSNDEVSEGLRSLAKRVRQFLLNNYSDDLTATAVAKKLNVSGRQMRRSLQAVDGEGFNKILQKIRLNESCLLLESSELSIAEIAQNVGFCEQSYFSALFKAQYLMSPSEYRKNKMKSGTIV